MKFLKITLLLFLILVSFLSCKKDSIIVSGKIIDGGDVAVDGCGWLVEIGSETYTPTNLETQYQIHNLNIELEYRLLGSKANCGFIIDTYDEIEILEIE